ncbi:ribosome biogenesis protein NSA1, partial [Tremellales sp. Uapishka_1]
MVRTYNFLAPSLHPNTLVDISISEPGPSSQEPLVRHLAVKHGQFNPLGSVRKMLMGEDGNLIVADHDFRISSLKLGSVEEPVSPEILSQHTVPSKKGATWVGLTAVQGGVVSGLSSGHLSYTSSSSSAPQSRNVPSPLTTVLSASSSSTSFGMAGKEVEVSLWDVEKTFSSPAEDVNMGKRKKDALEVGEIWRAKNLPNNNLSLRQPVYHLCMSFLNDTSQDIVTGTKAGQVRRYDTRQRKVVSNWKIAREGGIGAVQPGTSEHELFFSDRSSFLGSMDLRTGKLLYSYPKLTATAHHLRAVPTSTSNIGLATISSDSTFRLLSTTAPPADGYKGNMSSNTTKGEVKSMVGGVGVGDFLWRGWGEREVVVEKKERREKGEGEETDSEDEDEEIWEGMSEAAEDEDEDESEEEQPVPVKKAKVSRR